MQNLFGHLCSGEEFSHDRFMRDLHDQIDVEERPYKRMRSTSPTTSSNLSSSQGIEIRQVSQTGIDDSHLSTEGIQTIDPNQRSASLPTTDSPSYHSHDPASQNENKEMSEPEPQIVHEMNDRIRSLRDCLVEMQDEAKFAIAPLPSQMEEDRDNQHQTSGSQAASTDYYEKYRGQGPNSLNQFSLPTAPSHTSLLDGAEIAAKPESSQPSVESTSNEEESTTASTILSRKRRWTAYKAAKADTYDAWNEFALISAGNGHTEPEMEL
jgi:DNA cross-link repair 1C protein